MNWFTQLFQTFGSFLQWWIVVAPWERGLRVRLGKVAAELSPGIHFRIPFLDRIYLQRIRKRTVARTNQTVSTKDGLPITITVAIDFTVTDLRLLFDSLSSPEATLQYRVSSHIAEFVFQRTRAEIRPADLERHATMAIEDFGCGLGNIQVHITEFSFVRTLRLMSESYTSGAGLYHGFDS